MLKPLRIEETGGWAFLHVTQNQTSYSIDCIFSKQLGSEIKDQQLSVLDLIWS